MMFFSVRPYQNDEHGGGEDIDDKEVADINLEKAFLTPERICVVPEHILTRFYPKTYRGDETTSIKKCSY